MELDSLDWHDHAASDGLKQATVQLDNGYSASIVWNTDDSTYKVAGFCPKGSNCVASDYDTEQAAISELNRLSEL